MKLAIQPDFVRHANGEEQSYSNRWVELAQESEIETTIVNVFDHGAMNEIKSCDGFMWRFGYDARSLAMAKRIIPAIEHGLNIPVFPNANTCWHFEDKVAQRYLLEAASIPTPETYVFWTKADATSFIKTAIYPLVLKLSAGFQSSNVILARNSGEAKLWIDRLFGPGVNNLDKTAPHSGRQKWWFETKRLLQGRGAPSPRRNHNYFFAQEFLPDNGFDTRVTIIGDRAFAFRRMNRDNDFRSSGSGKLDWTPDKIDPATIALAFEVSDKLGTQSVAIDGLRRGNEPVVGEISYTYATWAIRECPGHWQREKNRSLVWQAGQLSAEDAIFADFRQAVQSRARAELFQPMRLELGGDPESHLIKANAIGVHR